MVDWIGPLVQNTGKASVLVGIGISLATLIMALGKTPPSGSKSSILDRCIKGQFPRLCEILALSVVGAVTAGYVVLAETPEFGNIWRLIGILAAFVFGSIVVVVAIELLLKLFDKLRATR